jgi:hypothetical protein
MRQAAAYPTDMTENTGGADQEYKEIPWTKQLLDNPTINTLIGYYSKQQRLEKIWK